MIEIKNLNKIYRSKKRKKCHALKDINLTLPDNGLVFILGKSGSGKSTLLNLIGGLDSITKGRIEVDGNNLSKFGERRFCNYRNSHIGFIFQDYHLIDTLTVYENIVLSLNLLRTDDNSKVKDALSKVGLASYEDRYPTELSGGEKQRIAIARAIVKNPRIILADEPTGNLDSETATSIIDLLKTLSNDCLILVVSHNTNDANNYADRIIELKDGAIISDRQKNPKYPNNVVYKNGVLYYPSDKVLDSNDIHKINNKLRKNKANKIVRITNKFIPTSSNCSKEDRVKIKNKGLSIKKEMKFSSIFLKRKLLSIAISSFIISAVMVIMALAQTIITFDGGKVISKEMKKVSIESVLVQKTTTEQEKRLTNSNYQFYQEITDEDIAEYRAAGYTDTIYPVYSHELILSDSGGIGSAGMLPTYLHSPPYLSATLGTLIVDEAFLQRKFNGLQYLAKADEFHPSGVIITDYIADAILRNAKLYKAKTYEDILGTYHYNSDKYERGYINGIIKTDYKEKHQQFFEDYNSGKFTSAAEITNNELFLNFADDVYAKYGYCFSLNPDFEKSFYENPSANLTYHANLKFNNNPYIVYSQFIIFNESYKNEFKDFADIDLVGNEIIMNYNTYNQIFGTQYTASNFAEVEPHTITLSHYKRDDLMLENPMWTKEVVVKKLTNHNTYTCIASEELYSVFQDDMMYSRALYFENSDQISAVLSATEKLQFNATMMLAAGIRTMTRAVEVFVPIFEIVAYVLCFAVVFVLINFSTKMISDKMHDIGILKALGTKNKSVAVIFGLQVLLIAILTCIISTIGYYVVLDLANEMLVKSLRKIAAERILPEVDFLTFELDVILYNCLLTFALSILSLIIPLMKIKRIKPVKIIKTRD